MNYKYHPILENLRVNEDGTSILYHGKPLEAKAYERKTNTVPMEVVTVNKKNVTVMRLVCECWHGLSENRAYVVRKIDPAKGNHYSNLCWSKQGLQSPNFNTLPKYTKEEFEQLQAERDRNESVAAFLRRRNISEKTYYAAKKRYEQEN